MKGLAANGSKIFSVCATGAAALHGIEDLSCISRMPQAHDRIANGAAVLADGRFISVSRDKTLRVWERDQCQVVPTPHDHSVKCVTASPSGSLVATGTYNGEVGLYDWQRGSWVTVVRPTASGVSCLSPTDSPNLFLASSYDGNVYEVRPR